MTWNVVMKSIRLRVEHRIPYLEYWFFLLSTKKGKEPIPNGTHRFKLCPN